MQDKIVTAIGREQARRDPPSDADLDKLNESLELLESNYFLALQMEIRRSIAAHELSSRCVHRILDKLQETRVSLLRIWDS